MGQNTEEEQDRNAPRRDAGREGEGKVMAIDYGSRKVGIAISNVERTVSFPREVIRNKGMDKLAEEVLTLANGERVTDIVLGLSVDQKGEENPVMKEIRAFANKLRKLSELPVYFEPEDMTTAEAVSSGKKGALDASAAALILQGFLERHERC